MKPQKTKLIKRKGQKHWINSFVKLPSKLWSKYFAKRKKPAKLAPQVTDDNWWEWV